MFESTLATTDDASLILKLYELRTEETLRKARHWMVIRYFPETAEEVLALLADATSEKNAWFRQVTSYWDMAASFVLHGALNAELFLDCNSEPFALFARYEPMLPQIRTKRPWCFTKIERIVQEFPEARTLVDNMAKLIPERREAARKAPPMD